jgi:hypothetical protein
MNDAILQAQTLSVYTYKTMKPSVTVHMTPGV